MTRREENRSRMPILTQDKKANRVKRNERINKSSIAGKEREWESQGRSLEKDNGDRENNGQQSIIGLEDHHKDMR